MKSWPLEQVAHLDSKAIALIVQSLAHAELTRCGVPSFAFFPYQDFIAMRWENLGLDQSTLRSFTQRCNLLFKTNVSEPVSGECCHVFCDSIWTAWTGGSRAIAFHSSGSTGQPKKCIHYEDDLRQEVSSAAPLFENCRRAVVTMPLYHIYGLVFGVLLPMSLQLPTHYTFPLPTIVAAHMRSGDVVMGIPLLWKNLIQTRHVQESTVTDKGITLLTATSPLSSDLGQRLVQMGFSIIDCFGYSEVGVVCWRRHPTDLFTLFPHIQRAEGLRQNQFKRQLFSGEIRYYPQMDHITWYDDHQLKLGTRIDRAVQVGGINVYPQEVAHILEKHPDVKKCLVRLMRPEEGFRLKAFIVPMSNCDPKKLLEELQIFALQNLTSFQRPGSYTLGAEIPTGPTGKPADW